MPDIFVLGGLPGPVGRHGGSCPHLRADDLLGRTMVAACVRASVSSGNGAIEGNAAGCVSVVHEGMGDIAFRRLAVAAGFQTRFSSSIHNPRVRRPGSPLR
jgi:acetyl-CoA acetyltransferase